jgi:hypothetical protein
MAGMLMPDDVVAAAATVEAALRPVADRDWSVRAGPLDWDVERTITHMIGATAKYTLYLASRCEHFIGLSVTRWPDATNQEFIDSIMPVAAGLAAVAAVTPPGVRAYHTTGPSSATGYSAAPASSSWCTPTTPSAVSASPSRRPPTCASGC